MRLFILTLLTLNLISVYAQNPEEDKIKTTNFPELRKIKNSDIPGAVMLGQPQQIKGKKQEIRTEKHGLIYPAFYDWNKDGKKDMLLGEFETGKTGSYIKVYLNKGSKTKPKYSGDYFYALDVNGDTLTNYQWCCIGIHPRIVDLDGDGFEDILSGQYNPGLISWWRGTEKGFLPRQFVEQEGYVEGARLKMDGTYMPNDPRSLDYWNYTSTDFGDFNGDGLIDLFVGGSGGMRVALNEGTKEKPKFGLRKYLHHVNGEILSHKRPSDEEITKQRNAGRYPLLAGGMKSYITPIDWDNDGVRDLLATHEYASPGHEPILFFRGVNTDKGVRYEKAVPLFTAADGSKIFPGCQPMITVTDYNNDGVRDIVFGVSIPTINGFEVEDKVAFGWVKDMKIEMPGKDAGRAVEWMGSMEEYIKKVESQPEMRQYYLGTFDDYKYLTLRHRGYVFVMYGEESGTRAAAKKVAAGPAEEIKVITNEQVTRSNVEGPVKFEVRTVERIKMREEYQIEVTMNFEEGWYGYAEEEAGFSPTQVNIEFPDYITKIGQAELISAKQGDKLSGEVKFLQKFSYPYPKAWDNVKSEIDIKALISYQPCCEDKELEPQEHEVNLLLSLKTF